jgi:hypothetical protein
MNNKRKKKTKNKVCVFGEGGAMGRERQISILKTTSSQGKKSRDICFYYIPFSCRGFGGRWRLFSKKSDQLRD